MLIPLDAPQEHDGLLASIKAQLKVQHSRDDGLILEYIAAATDYIGQQAELVLEPTSLEQRLDCWPCGGRCLILAAGPVRDVESVTYLDADGAEIEVDEGLWRWEPTAGGAELWFTSAFTRPTLEASRRGAVRIAFEAGFNLADAPDPVDPRLNLPPRAAQARRMLVMHWYEHRGAIIAADQPYPIPMAVDTLIDSLRVYRS